MSNPLFSKNSNSPRTSLNLDSFDTLDEDALHTWAEYTKIGIEQWRSDNTALADTQVNKGDSLSNTRNPSMENIDSVLAEKAKPIYLQSLRPEPGQKLNYGLFEVSLQRPETSPLTPNNSSFDSVFSNQISHLRTCKCLQCGLPPVDPKQVENSLQPLTVTLQSELDLSQTFLLNSLPEANHTIYLDFNGHTDAFGNVSPVFDIDNNPATFSDFELERIQYIWQRVAEDFSPFNVNVTTQEPTLDRLIRSGSTDTTWGIRVAIGGSSSVGGIASLGSFSSPDSADPSASVFPIQTGMGNEKYTADTITHEVGHTLGLVHDGRTSPSEEYYYGHGEGETGWAPIMGVGYYQNLVQWSQGQYLGANNPQDDLAIITTQNGFDYRADDTGNTLATATPLTLTTFGTAVSARGIIERNTDVDVYSFTTDAGTINLMVTPSGRGPNLDVLAQLYNSSGTLVAESNPVDLLSASITTTVSAGTYYLKVDGVGKGDPLGTGYTDYGSLGQYQITGTIINDNLQLITLALNPTSVREDGNANLVYTFTRTGPTTNPLTVNYSIAGSADASDYSGATPGSDKTITFAAGANTATLILDPTADTTVEANETVALTLLSGTGYTVGTTAAINGTILNDDANPGSVIRTPIPSTVPGKTRYEVRNEGAFAALKADGSVVTWGVSAWGGNSSGVASQLSGGVTQIFSTNNAFAALKSDGSVVTWGDASSGGDSSSVTTQLSSGVIQIFSTVNAFAALKSNGSVITWGYSDWGGNSSAVATQLSSGVTEIVGTHYAFAALKSNGSVITWGESAWGGNSSSVATQLTSGVTQIFSTQLAFAALKGDGSVVTWGEPDRGGNSSAVASQLAGGVTQIFSNRVAFAALKNNGSVVTWGLSFWGGDSSSVATQLSGGVTQIFSTNNAFAALKSNGSVVTWGDASNGGDSSGVAIQLSGGVTQIFSTNNAFAALKSNGSVVTWGDTGNGGDSSGVASQLSSDVTQIFSTNNAFAALKNNGSVVTWGDASNGGDSSGVASQLSSGVTQIFSIFGAFAALKNDGSVVTWGNANNGGNSSGVTNQLSGGVVFLADPFHDDRLTPSPSLVTLAVSPSSVPEDDTANLVYTFSRSGPTTNPLTVNYSIGGTADASDYTGATPGTGKTLTFAAGASTATLTLDPTADTAAEADETVALTLASGTGYAIGTSTAVTGTIANDDLPVISLTLSPASVTEAGTPNLVYTFSRTGPTTNPLTVNYSIAGTANGSDYTGATPGTGKTLTFAAGASTATLTLDPTADTTLEPSETVTLNLVAGTGYTISTTGAVTGTILNSPVITLAVSPGSVIEDGSDNLVYTFSRTGPTTNPLTVRYTIGGTANASDYTGATPGTGKTLTFAAGASTATLTLDPTVDSVAEADETVALTLASGTSYAIGTATSVIGTITNDDLPRISLNVSPASVTEAGTPNLVYTFSRTGPTTNPLTVNYSIAGTANASDYTGATPGTGKTITFAAGASTATLTLDPTADTTVEPSETVTLNLVAGTGYTIDTTGAVTGTILDSPVITLAVSPASVTEDGSANLVYTFTRTGPTTNPLTVNYSIGGTADGSDYTGATPGTGKTITFAAGASTATLTLDPTADTIAELSETLSLNLVAGTGYTLGTTTPINSTITNDDADPSTITLAVSPTDVTEDGTQNLVYTFTRTNPTNSALTVKYTIAGSTDATDYTGATPGTGKTITFAAGASTATLTIDPTADTLVEDDETVTLTLAAGAGYIVGTPTAISGTLTNDDLPLITLTPNSTSAREDGNANLVYTFIRTGPTTNPLTVNYSLTGTADATDYTGATPGTGKTITFAAGASTATLTIDPTVDTIIEANETVALNLLSGTGYTVGTTSTINGTILNDDASPGTVIRTPISPTETGKTRYEVRNDFAFAALKADGSVVTWGLAPNGGNSSIASGVNNQWVYTSVADQLTGGVTQIFSNRAAFVALKTNGSVVTWGFSLWGGDSSSVASQLSGGVTQIFSTNQAFAALKSDGSVITWGDGNYGGNSSAVASQLTSGVTQIFSNDNAFAALKSDGSVITWGDGNYGGNSSAVASQLTSGVTQIFSTEYAFAALKSDGSVVTWGDSGRGGNSSGVASQLSGGVTQIFSAMGAFAALKSDGSVVTWGISGWGGDSSGVASQLNGGVTQIFSTSLAFAALKSNGSVVTWGVAHLGGNSSIATLINNAWSYVSVASQLTNGVTQIFANDGAFAALKSDGSVVTWGDATFGGNSSNMASQLSNGVTQIFSTQYAFAALKSDGSVVTWGKVEDGGDSSGVASQLTNGVTQIFANNGAFAALKSDGSLVTWGRSESGGNSSGVTSQLSGGVVSLADPFHDDRLTPSPSIVTLAVSPAAVTEDGTPNLVYTFTRTGPTTAPLTVNYSIGGTADASDYSGVTPGTGKTITFAAGSNTATLTLDPTADTTIEADETVALTLVSGTGYAIGTPGPVTGTLTNDDFSVITLAASDASAGETANPGRFTLTRSGPTTSALTVNLEMTGTATNGTDYTALPATATFAVGAATAVVTLNPIDDLGVEGNETAILTLFPGSSYSLGATTSATVTITDNDRNGTSGNETLTGDAGNNLLNGLEGNDTLNGGAGNDSLDGGAGNDVLVGGAGADSLDGGVGTDTLSYSGSATGVTINLATNTASGGDASGDTIANLENVTGSNGDDSLTGNTGNNTLSGGAGNDTLMGDAGSDVLNGGAGADSLDGGVGTDTLSYSGSATGVTINLATNAAAGGDASGDTIANLENVTGSNGDDNLTGNTGNNTLSGGIGNDTLIGDAGNDSLVGGDGNDSLVGGAGKDTLTGGAGIDQFILSALGDSLLASFDRLTDYTLGDLIDAPSSLTPVTLTATSGNATSLSTAALQAVLTNTILTANSAQAFTVTGQTGTFIALNDGVAGFNASTDSILHLSSYTIGGTNTVTLV
jgi:Ca2+-binding RTX toxin-like protein